MLSMRNIMGHCVRSSIFVIIRVVNSLGQILQTLSSHIDCHLIKMALFLEFPTELCHLIIHLHFQVTISMYKCEIYT